MKKSILVITSAIGGLFSCGQGSRSTPTTVDIETINSVRNYEYVDSMGKRIIIHNSLPNGDSYTDPAGKKYFKVIFWTRVFNETDAPLELKIDFPLDQYEIPGLPGKYYKVLVPPDTMTIDKEPLHYYGLTGLKSFLDSNIHKPSSLKRTIIPKESSGFYIVILSLTTEGTPGGILRTGLNLRGQNLFYKISRYASKVGLPLIGENEIPCGSINLKILRLTK